MNFLLSTWILWFIISMGCLVLLGMLGKNRKTEVMSGMATTSEQFSMKTVFFSFRKGEADMFFTVLCATISFFLFSMGFVTEILLMVF